MVSMAPPNPLLSFQVACQARRPLAQGDARDGAVRVPADEYSLQIEEIRRRQESPPCQQRAIPRINIHECHYDAFRWAAVRTRVE